MGWPSFSVHGRSVRRVEGAYAGMVERTYAGDVTSVRAGLRRRILLRLRESAKIIVPGAELAFGSNSVIFSHNAVSELLRVYTVSAEVAHSDPLTLFHTFPILHILFF